MNKFKPGDTITCTDWEKDEWGTVQFVDKSGCTFILDNEGVGDYIPLEHIDSFTLCTPTLYKEEMWSNIKQKDNHICKIESYLLLSCREIMVLLLTEQDMKNSEGRTIQLTLSPTKLSVKCFDE